MGTFLSYVLDEMFIAVPLFQENYPSLKISGLPLAVLTKIKTIFF